MDCPPLVDYVLTDHARTEMNRRRLSEADVDRTVRAPGQRHLVRPGRCVFQAKLVGEDGHPYVVRVFVDVDRRPPEIVTAYRTSKVSKYWG